MRRHRPWPTVEDFNTGKSAIGTGPYVLKSYVKGAGIELARNEELLGRQARVEGSEAAAGAQRRAAPGRPAGAETST